MTEGTPQISVRACANLPGFRFGEIATVDPADPYIAELLGALLIVRVADEKDTTSPDAGESAGAEDETAGVSDDGD